MKFIILQNLDSVNKSAYNSTVRAAYLLGEKTVCSGSLSESMYFLAEIGQRFPIDAKLKMLKSEAKTAEDILRWKDADKIVKDFKKFKNRSGPLREEYKKFIEGIDEIFSNHIQSKFEIVDAVFGIKILKELLNEEHFYFYAHDTGSTHFLRTLVVPKIELLQLLLPDPEKGHPIFLINHKDDAENLLVDFEIENPSSTTAANLNSFYGQHSFNFSLMTMLNENELATVREELGAPTLKIRQLLNEWIEICYKNPNTTLGLEFFRENLLEIIDATKNIPLENQTLNNYADITPLNFNSEIIFGEAPIEKIWEIYKNSNTITEEDFEQLLLIKKEQSPKFDGRWPIALWQPVPIKRADVPQDEIVSVRKSIPLD